jgi:hypothetical protein
MTLNNIYPIIRELVNKSPWRLSMKVGDFEGGNSIIVHDAKFVVMIGITIKPYYLKNVEKLVDENYLALEISNNGWVIRRYMVNLRRVPTSDQVLHQFYDFLTGDFENILDMVCTTPDDG